MHAGLTVSAALQLAMIFIGYIFLSLHYVSTTVFVANQANALFFRISLLGNVLGIIIAALFLYASSLNIAIGYCVALSARGAMLALVAWYFWRISLPLFEIFVSTAAVGAGLLAVHVRSTPVTLAVVVVIATLLIWYGLRFRAQVRRLNLGGL